MTKLKASKLQGLRGKKKWVFPPKMTANGHTVCEVWIGVLCEWL